MTNARAPRVGPHAAGDRVDSACRPEQSARARTRSGRAEDRELGASARWLRLEGGRGTVDRRAKHLDDAEVYQLRRPAEALRRHVEHSRFVTSTAGAPVDLRVDVFVDARADLIFNFGAAYARTVIGGERRAIARSNLDAQRLVPIRIEQSGRVRTTGVRFHLGGLAPFATVSLHEVTGRTPTPEHVLGTRVRALEANLEAEHDPDRQAAALDAFFLESLFPMFEGARTFTLTAEGSSTRFEMAEHFRGALLPMVKSSLPDFAPVFDRYAADLKRACEA